jgi:hypothetical protein
VVQVLESNTPSMAALVSSRFELLLQAGEPFAVSIVHTTLRERPIAEVYDVVEGPAETYRHPGGEIVQCSCCRRVLHPAEPDRWDFVPSLVAEPLPAAQTVCELCGQLHYVGMGPAPGEPAQELTPGPPARRYVHAL